ncbi:Na(+)/H(+) antiporter NhaA [bacterium BMS3Bbin12]|nr:Na(+)/H(+) antiporter NhaA [bacterium BMS3Bbin12]GBE51115.1 Na(+)/H(+) antiporter NhaA [bacterium BMS3Bbin13]
MHGHPEPVHTHKAPWENAFSRLLTPMEEFIRHEATGGVILMACAALALILANSPAAELYHHVLNTPIGFQIGNWRLEKSLHHWINDGLMTLFFFVVGLEIKREVLVGELASLRQAALPVAAAVGGMAVPALIYAAINPGGPYLDGWGVPMATDIAFAVGVLVLLGRRIPKGLITFLLALAIVDDLGAVLVIALFYTSRIAAVPLAGAAALLVLLVVFNRSGIRHPLPYFLTGTLLWLMLLYSGIHATIAGVLTALTIPARARYDPRRFSDYVRELMERYDRAGGDGSTLLGNIGRSSLVHNLEQGTHRVATPLQRLEHTLHLPVALVVMPLFALANAGIPLDAHALRAALTHPATLGVFLGLVAGKFIGIAGVTWVGVRLGLGRLPAGTGMRHIVGIGLIGGIGFTMSIFIAELAFPGSGNALMMAKTGVLLASVCAGLGGYLWLLAVTRRPAAPPGACQETEG